MSLTAARAALPAALLVLMAGCSQLGLVSSWARPDVAVDGQQTEWQGLLQQPEGQSVAWGVMNDADYLYVTLSSLDQRTLMQIMSRGLTVWFDTQGRNRTVLGVRYPIGAVTMGLQEEGFGQRNRRRQSNPEELLEQMMGAELWIEVTGPEKGDLARIIRGGEGGIQVDLASKLGQFVYELRIPLDTSSENPHALGVTPGETIGIGFVAGGGGRGNFSRPGGGGFRGMGRPGGDPRGGMGRPGGGLRLDGGRDGDYRGQRSRPLNVWFRVTLATPAAQAGS